MTEVGPKSLTLLQCVNSRFKGCNHLVHEGASRAISGAGRMCPDGIGKTDSQPMPMSHKCAVSLKLCERSSGSIGCGRAVNQSYPDSYLQRICALVTTFDQEVHGAR